MSFDALSDCSGPELANEIGLSCSAGHDCSGFLVDGFGKEEFEFASFVAASCESCEIIAFDPDFGAKLTAEVGEKVARSGKDAQRDSREHCGTV